jgi:CBS domain-containing protein
MVTAKAIMSTNVITVTRDEDIYKAIRTMVQNNVTGLPVVNKDGTVAGVLTEKDVLNLLYEIKDRPGKAEDYMTRDVVCFDCQDSATDIAESFRSNHFRRVPILENGKLVGIISRKDIIRYMRDSRHDERVSKDSTTGTLN